MEGNRLKRMVCLIGVFVFLFAGQIFGQDKYRDYDEKFSFTLPDGWEAIPADKLPAETSKAITNSFKDHVLALCQERGSDYLMSPSILVQSRAYEGSAENAAILLGSPKGSESLIAEAKTVARWLSRRQEGKFDVTYTDGYFDDDRHIGYGEVETENKDGTKIFVVMLKFLGADSITVLRCYWHGTYSDEFQDLVYELVDSFSYENGYAFKQRSTTEGQTQDAIYQQDQDDDSGYEEDEDDVQDSEDSELDGVTSVAVEMGFIGVMVTLFFVNSFVFAICLWLGMKIMGESGPFWALLVTAVSSSIAGMIPIPFMGWMISFVVMYILLGKLADIEGGVAVAMVIIAQIIRLLVVIVLLGALIGFAV